MIIERIVEAARLEQSDLVVEIGPGHGKMTRMLSERVAKVLAIELDEHLYEKLKRELAGYGNIELILGDALDYPYEDLPGFKVVANIPYYITTPIIFRLLEMEQIAVAKAQETTEEIPLNPPAALFEEGGQRGILKRGGAAFRTKKNIESMTLTVQKEVAERIVAKPGGKDYGVLSIMVQYHAKPRLEFIIPKEAFRPVPKVDSAVIHIEILDKPSVDVLNEEIFSRVVKTAFSQRRKMLSNSLKSLREDIKEWLSRAGIDPSRRPETLSIEEFARLANIF